MYTVSDIIIQVGFFLFLKNKLQKLVHLLSILPNKKHISTRVKHGFTDEIGSLGQYLGIRQDLKSADEDPLSNTGFFDSVFQSMLNGMVIIDENRSIQMINQVLLNLLGYKESELFESPIEKLFPNVPEELGSKENFSNACSEVLLHGSEASFIKKNGDLLPVMLSCSFIKDSSNKNQGIVCVVQDITEIKRMEGEQKNLEEQLRQSQKMEAIGTLAGGIAHDFNNILSTMQGFTWLLLADKPEDSEERDYLNEIHKAGERASSLIQQILTFSRIDNQELKPLKLPPLIKEALRFMRATTPSSIEIRQDIDPDCSTILANATQIHQIIINLCTNALHAMKQGQGLLEITLKEVSAKNYNLLQPDQVNDHFLMLDVKDSGHGILPGDKDRIFEPFFTTKEVGEGTGLGLSVVHGIIKNHNGKIIVDSEEGKGSSFKIFFPVIEHQTPKDTSEKRMLPQKGQEHILIVEDEPSLARFYEIAFKQLGYGATVERNGEDALKTFNMVPEAFDVVFTDHAMPRMSGIQLSRKLLDRRSDLPIILATGYNALKLKEEAGGVGIRYFLEKPVYVGHLTHIIREIFGPSKKVSNKKEIDSSNSETDKSMLDNAEDVIHKSRAFRDIIPLFLRERRKEASSVLRAIDQSNYERIYALGHKMQGASEAFGFTTVSKIGETLKQSAMKGENELIQNKILELKDYLDQLERDYKSY